MAEIFIPKGNHYFQALASTLQFVAQVCDRLWLIPATDRKMFFCFALDLFLIDVYINFILSVVQFVAHSIGWMSNKSKNEFLHRNTINLFYFIHISLFPLNAINEHRQSVFVAAFCVRQRTHQRLFVWHVVASQ